MSNCRKYSKLYREKGKSKGQGVCLLLGREVVEGDGEGAEAGEELGAEGVVGRLPR